jgi:hypothetical protein
METWGQKRQTATHTQLKGTRVPTTLGSPAPSSHTLKIVCTNITKGLGSSKTRRGAHVRAAATHCPHSLSNVEQSLTGIAKRHTNPACVLSARRQGPHTHLLVAPWPLVCLHVRWCWVPLPLPHQQAGPCQRAQLLVLTTSRTPCFFTHRKSLCLGHRCALDNNAADGVDTF